jgi:hypothetical protein
VVNSAPTRQSGLGPHNSFFTISFWVLNPTCGTLWPYVALAVRHSEKVPKSSEVKPIPGGVVKSVHLCPLLHEVNLYLPPLGEGGFIPRVVTKATQATLDSLLSLLLVRPILHDLLLPLELRLYPGLKSWKSIAHMSRPFMQVFWCPSNPTSCFTPTAGITFYRGKTRILTP